MSKTKPINIGDKYGEYIVLTLPSKIHGHLKVKCQCKCGLTKDVYVYDIKKLTCCLICSRKNRRKYKEGSKFGALTIMKILPNNKYYVKCDCNNEYIMSRRPAHKMISCRQCYLKINGPQHPTFQGFGYISKVYFSILQNNAKKYNREFAISIEYINNLLIEQNHKCKLSNLPIVIGNSKTETTASLDRIDSSKGYIEGNVQWIHKDINRMKSNFEEKYFIKMCKLITKNNS